MHPLLQPRWEEEAACRGYPTWWWFAIDTVEAVEAFSICTACPVQADCLTFALDHPYLVGIWAGTTYDDRQRRRTARRARSHPRADDPGER